MFCSLCEHPEVVRPAALPVCEICDYLLELWDPHPFVFREFLTTMRELRGIGGSSFSPIEFPASFRRAFVELMVESSSFHFLRSFNIFLHDVKVVWLRENKPDWFVVGRPPEYADPGFDVFSES